MLTLFFHVNRFSRLCLRSEAISPIDIFPEQIHILVGSDKQGMILSPHAQVVNSAPLAELETYLWDELESLAIMVFFSSSLSSASSSRCKADLSLSILIAGAKTGLLGRLRKSSFNSTRREVAGFT